MIFITNQTLAGEHNKQYTMYNCDNTENCTGNCTPAGKQVSFLVDKARGVVMATFYENDEISNTATFKECTAVFNSENWDCSWQQSIRSGVLMSEIKMINNNYLARTRALFPEKGTVEVFNNTCAKL
jgi:hypothetical protein